MCYAVICEDPVAAVVNVYVYCTAAGNTSWKNCSSLVICCVFFRNTFTPDSWLLGGFSLAKKESRMGPGWGKREPEFFYTR